MQAPGHVQAIHPDHGEAVVYLPGETLPQWAAEAFEKQKPEPERDGQFVVFRLKPKEKKS